MSASKRWHRRPEPDARAHMRVAKGDSRRAEDVARDRTTRDKKPLEVLEEVLHWLRDRALRRD
jgi:hypothetical protein